MSKRNQLSNLNRVSDAFSSSSSEEDNSYMGSLDPKEILSNVKQQLAEKNKKLLEEIQAVNFEPQNTGSFTTNEINPTIYNKSPEIKPNLNMLLGKVAPAPVAGGSASAAGGGRASSVLTGIYPASQHDYIRNLLEIQKLTPEGILKKYDKQALDDAINIIEDREANIFKKAIPFKFVWPKMR